MGRLWGWLVSKVIYRIIIFGCILAAIMVFSRFVDMLNDFSPWLIKAGVAFLIYALILTEDQASKQRVRIDELEAQLAKQGGRAPGRVVGSDL